MIVVDTNVLASFYLPGPHTTRVLNLYKAEPAWAAPVLWRSEFRNTLAGYLRRRLITFDQACSIQSEAERLMAGAEYEVESRSVLALVRDSRCSAYDCEFVALATQLDTRLFTMDQQLIKAFPERVVGVTHTANRELRP